MRLSNNNRNTVILAHNYPGGVAAPSAFDGANTHTLEAALTMVKVVFSITL